MSQTALITLLAILLYTGGFFGGFSSKSDYKDAPPPAVSTTEQHGVIRANTVAVHEQPRSREVIAHLVRGDHVTILSESDGWYRVRMANGQIGYVNTFAVASASTSSPRGRSGKYEVVAYYLSDSRLPSMPSLQENIDIISTVIPWMWQVTPLGLAETDFSAGDVARALQLAGSHGVKSQALIHNIGETQTGAINFSGSMIHQVLADPDDPRPDDRSDLPHLVNWGMNGVHVDFENVQPSDRQNLNQFLKELYERLKPAGLDVSIAVPAKTQESYVNSFSGAYDYATISPLRRRHDDHGLRRALAGRTARTGRLDRLGRDGWSGTPSRPVCRRTRSSSGCRRTATTGRPTVGGGPSRTDRPMEQASQHGARIQWDDTAKVPYYRYGAGRTVYFEDRSSLSHKLKIVKEYGLGGISLWRLGQEDPGIWSVIRQQLG